MRSNGHQLKPSISRGASLAAKSLVMGTRSLAAAHASPSGSASTHSQHDASLQRVQTLQPPTLLRIARNTSSLTLSTVAGMPHVTVVQPTLAAPGAVAKLATAIKNMSAVQPPQTLAGRYILSSSTIKGGQAIVVFARDAHEGFLHYAIKCVVPLCRRWRLAATCGKTKSTGMCWHLCMA